MKAYTGGGDGGMTSLLSGERVAKTHCRVEACGEVDELSCVVGALIASLPKEDRGLRDELLETQGELFRLGAILAATRGSHASGMFPKFGPEPTRRLEELTDRLEEQLPPLQGFVFPGGHPTAAWAHLARAVARRAERRVVQCFQESAEGRPDAAFGDMIPYLNRLSSFLFAVARFCNSILGVPERTWPG
ncbi:MAG TPA: cob(I)yrinic acid a,c-diamide adenosyltransferase [Spirochaetia bacterium]|nr:cob(I)yrinic acid a,c-diamide adenosyltransferase [Spirochaetia bacterium]